MTVLMVQKSHLLGRLMLPYSGQRNVHVYIFMLKRLNFYFALSLLDHLLCNDLEKILLTLFVAIDTAFELGRFIYLDFQSANRFDPFCE